MIIHLYRIRSGFSNVADEISLVRPDGTTIYWEADYALPSGFDVSTDDLGNPVIVSDGSTWGIGCNLNGQVCIADGSSIRYLSRVYARDPAAKTLKERRAERGLSQQNVADLLAMPIRQYQKYEKGECSISNMTLAKAVLLADALDVSDLRDLL